MAGFGTVEKIVAPRQLRKECGYCGHAFGVVGPVSLTLNRSAPGKLAKDRRCKSSTG